AERRDLQQLYEWIRRHPSGSVTIRDVCRSNSRKYPTAQCAMAAMTKLKDSGLCQWSHTTPGPQGGRPTHRMEVIQKRKVTVPRGQQQPPANKQPSQLPTRPSVDRHQRFRRTSKKEPQPQEGLIPRDPMGGRGASPSQGKAALRPPIVFNSIRVAHGCRSESRLPTSGRRFE
ncbi:MAG: hypothetical protein JWP89_5795, partial [Schlesneria sp.]|nr:hypothetical protein [Schlesneria sp.]